MSGPERNTEDDVGTLTLEQYNVLSQADLERLNVDEYGTIGGRGGELPTTARARMTVYVRGGGVAVSNPQHWNALPLPEPEDVRDAGGSASEDDAAIIAAGVEERQRAHERAARQRRRRRRENRSSRQTENVEAA